MSFQLLLLMERYSPLFITPWMMKTSNRPLFKERSRWWNQCQRKSQGSELNLERSLPRRGLRPQRETRFILDFIKKLSVDQSREIISIDRTEIRSSMDALSSLKHRLLDSMRHKEGLRSSLIFQNLTRDKRKLSTSVWKWRERLKDVLSNPRQWDL